MRSYSKLILISGLFDSIHNSDSEVVKFADKVFNPTVQLVEHDCQTTIGEQQVVDKNIIGKVEVVTNQTIDANRVNQLLSQGIYKIGTRDPSICVSSGGICQADYGATILINPPTVGSHVTLNTTNRLPFLAYLARSYSGAVVGIESTPTQNLPIRSGLYEEFILRSELDRIASRVLNSYLIPKTYREYYNNILYTLEKALYLIAIYQLFIE